MIADVSSAIIIKPMKEVTIRIRFTQPCLGNAKLKDGSGRFEFARTPSGQITFLASWHNANMRMASQLFGRYQGEVPKIRWDVEVTPVSGKTGQYKRFTRQKNGKTRFARHEALLPGDMLDIRCAVPATISNNDLKKLMTIAGQYKGLSPWHPGEFGHFEVVEVRDTIRR